MNNATRTLLAIVSICCIISPVAFGESLKVQCLDPDGSPLNGAEISVVCLTCRVGFGEDLKKEEEECKSGGVAEFKGLDRGIYRVYGRKKGFVPALFEYVELRSPSESIKLEFLEGEDRKLYFEDYSLVDTVMSMQDSAMLAFDEERYIEAEKKLQEAISLNPSDLDSYTDLAKVYFKQSKYEEGEKILKEVSRLASLLMQIRNPYVSPEEYGEKQEEAQEMLNKIPLLKTEDAYREKKYDIAVTGFRKAAEENPYDPVLHAKLAATLANLSKYDEAMQVVEKAMQLDPDDENIVDLKNQITAAHATARLNEARELLREGDDLLKAKDFENALTKFEMSIPLLPERTHAPVYRRIALIQAELEQHDAALRSFREAIRLAPKDQKSDYIRPLFEYYLSVKKYDDALTLLADPGKMKPAEEEAILMMAAEKYSETIPDFSEIALERAIDVNPENFDACFKLGKLYYSDGEEYDVRARVLLNRYCDNGSDPVKLEEAKNMLVVINERTPEL